VLQEGSLAVSARHLYEIVKALPEASVTLKKAQNNYFRHEPPHPAEPTRGC
jgi:DNA polymerase-3 subunit beta